MFSCTLVIRLISFCVNIHACCNNYHSIANAVFNKFFNANYRFSFFYFVENLFKSKKKYIFELTYVIVVTFPKILMHNIVILFLTHL